MKVVLFCGGLGIRLRDYSESIPKPMVNIGCRPILWHVMRYYAHYGHKDFILCLGWKADVIKDYFLNYDECVSNNFVLNSGKSIKLLNSDIHDWTITFVDTGLGSNIGQRLKAVEPYLRGEEAFLANYSDGLTDMHLPSLIDHFYRHDAVATCLAVKPRQSFHLLTTDRDGFATDITAIGESDLWMNGGFFAFQSTLFDYLKDGEELVVQPFQRLMVEKRLNVFKYNGFWACMDTYKEKQLLEDVYNKGQAPWEVWKRSPESVMASSHVQ